MRAFEVMAKISILHMFDPLVFSSGNGCLIVYWLVKFLQIFWALFSCEVEASS